MKHILTLCWLSLALVEVTYCQNQDVLKGFWRTVSVKYQSKQIDAGMRLWLNGIAEKQTGNFAKGVALLKEIEHQPQLQEKILHSVYLNNPHKETIRRILASMCGSYSIGNPVADYIYSKYSKDLSMQKLISTMTIEKEQQESKMMEQDSIKESFENKLHEAQFPGGQNAYARFLQSNLKIPDSAIGINGNVIVEFIIDTNGNISNAKIISNYLGNGIEDAVLRVINLLPKWSPAKQNDLPIQSVKRQSFNF